MCGITGFVPSKAISQDKSTEIIGAMNGRLHHRGPDSGGHWICAETGLVLGHRRLAIVELSPLGAQPMLSPCGRFSLVFNGEIYNFKELRAELELMGVSFLGHSDTEVLLHGFMRWGFAATLEKAVGMFALAFYDQQSGDLSLARDRFGEKPLYYGVQQGAFLFASELSALRVTPFFSGDLCRQAIADYLVYNRVNAPRSIYQNIFKLCPGHFIVVNTRAPAALPEQRSYWSVAQAYQQAQRQPVASRQEAIAGVDHLLQQAVRQQMIADVPLGAFLSGGIDSSLVVAAMQYQASKPVKTFSIGFSEPEFNEAEHAARVAKHLGCEHTELYVDANDALALVPEMASVYDEPFADSSQLPTYLVCQMARQHVTVALSGDGGDELFAGYSRYQGIGQRWQAIQRMPAAVRKITAGLMGGAAKVTGSGRFRVRQAWLNSPSLLSLYEDSIYPRQMLDLLQHPETSQAPLIDLADDMTAMQLYDITSYMVDDILVKVDRASMAHSLETRIPLLDHRLAEYALSIPNQFNVEGGVGKQVLRQLLYRYVPQEMVDRPKRGFAVPIAQWLRGPLLPWAQTLINTPDPYLKQAMVEQLWRSHQSGQDRSRSLWTILMFRDWYQKVACGGEFAVPAA
ncbi:asparagine synthase (glutamine-hydrolyzing) [Corallincola luteus]|uniref:asparagine synthase (glutamine-hydrolyzing) n=1 Tax=Corallincola luteus TaxID=1775177 RepID=A0ABY2AML6_9GAMM|nr:asparagine synthase (glutamine-hydrolyzing) [Corallincola luteus]TCI04444.1 asparagine synthase (glutamine-hydrolyzing) [Corallincola luteus]